ncbi:iron-sulfur cluster assembly scaffold protein [Clostridium sp.]|uniref:iron-sulfur cluster assembly scaffold protein n=1 Tax=Clostridium sp. TaxID=1506 RepID=UPI001A4C3B33|nr:iron-sulfur cluster assembly scaffold protein [Clostridium sp.]MBK5236712.1 iron-sulfur cluster assembly scaffold protein [Clostridium sp.]
MFNKLNKDKKQEYKIKDADGVGEVGNVQCGDIMRIFIKVKNNITVDTKFMIFGCGSAVASSSMATEIIKGKTLEEAWEITNKSVADSLDGLLAVKMHCTVLAEEVIHAAINDYRVKQGLEPWVSNLAEKGISMIKNKLLKNAKKIINSAYSKGFI